MTYYNIYFLYNHDYSLLLLMSKLLTPFILTTTTMSTTTTAFPKTINVIAFRLTVFTEFCQT